MSSKTTAKDRKGVSLALSLALELEISFAELSPHGTIQSLNAKEEKFVARVQLELKEKIHHNKTTIEKMAHGFGIDNQNLVKELTELAIVLEAQRIAQSSTISIRDRYRQIVDLYYSHVNLSHRTSLSILMQQYSTAAPISFLVGLWVKSPKKEALYFEPSAGNGLLCHALPVNAVHVNELDEIRLKNLRYKPYKCITHKDGSLPFGYGKLFDGVLTNPPFGDLEKVEVIDGFHIKKLEHLMAIRAMDCMKDQGRAAIIIGGHTRYDDESGIILNKGDRYFLNYLYHFYHVEDIIPIDGHKLYSRQGTAFDTRLILISSRKESPSGIADYAPIIASRTAHLHEVVNSFDALFERVINNDLEHFIKISKHLS